MSSPAALYAARWIATGAGQLLRDHALLVNDDGRIERIAPRTSFETADTRVYDLGEAVILPGLINVHAHPELSAFRGLLDDLPFHQWIPTLMRCKREAQLTAADYETSALWTCVESLRAGITCMGATEDSGAAVSALNASGMRGVVFLETFGPSPADADASMQALRDKIALHSPHASERVRVGVSPHAPYSVSDELFARVAAYARAENLPLATHAAEAVAEEELVREGEGPFAAGLRARGIAVAPRGASTIDVLARAGVLDCAPLVIHGIRLSADDIRALAAAGATIAHCPIANARLGHGIAPIVEAMEAGIQVALGTDSVASNNRLDLLEEAHVAQAMQRARLQSHSALPGSELLRMITVSGARALGMADRTGTLEAGKDADFCAVRLDTAHSIPVADPLTAAFHSARGSDVFMTVAHGRVLFENGRLTTLDESDLARRVNAIAQRLRAARDRQ
jgi:cytosine/adenosine deaminase-related metal-dependent hydrolase